MPSTSTRATATEFIEEAFETAVDEGSKERLLRTIDDAASALREQTAFVLDDFHRVQNPRVMDEDYFELVLEFYDELVEAGPLP